MHWIVIAIIVVIIVFSLLKSLVCFLWDSGIIPFLLGVTVWIVGIFAVFLLYSLMGYPLWLIGAVVIFLIAYNGMLRMKYLRRKNSYIKILNDASAQSKEIVHDDEEIDELMKNEISDIINEAGMATDAEIFKKLKLDADIEKLNKKKEELHIKLKIFDTYTGIVSEMRATACKKDKKKILAEQLKALLVQEEIEIKTRLNGDEKTAETWDNNLYAATRPCMEGSNMLPTIRLEID